MTMMHSPPHPGEVLKELYLEPLNLTITEAAKGLQIARKTLSMLVNCHAGVSAEMALKLAKAFNTTPESWLNMQQQYSLWESERAVDTSQIRTFSWPHNENEHRA
ncbi:XRE family Transcriptional regulator [Wuchereria bancrofti]|jgi:addiction module HigA family antidote|uniref:XRE family Transcriptional regulator n=1 Tax=Wuchereria bancrofti TaxID=6293 RepID=J9B498_WUCBA|nr:XRE family Transcriptional regulator [Wuchereria bancrofti]